ncbi:hypothetical protein PR202_ga21177 [Eleusine coracana subsp. coracana]|uniref:Uncharacterized protein n=1 Tax=Eleusine coracana subsp. coracana TaxID=191504 RepID=A0AAV5D0E6_ELECO|nr:hypothetical protein PR202_ga21177 [Eleusine coracana subsp. coracana]
MDSDGLDMQLSTFLGAQKLCGLSFVLGHLSFGLGGSSNGSVSCNDSHDSGSVGLCGGSLVLVARRHRKRQSRGEEGDREGWHEAVENGGGEVIRRCLAARVSNL